MRADKRGITMLFIPEYKAKEIPLDEAVESMKAYSNDEKDLLQGLENFRDEIQNRTRAISSSEIYEINCYNTIFKGMQKLV